MSKSLPAQPSLEQLRNQAKDLLKSHKSAEPEALRRIREHHPRWSNQTELEITSARFSLSDAQLVIAREYGFPGWPKLKAHVDSLRLASGDPLDLLKQALRDDEAALARQLLAAHPGLKAKLNEPLWPFDSPAITAVRSRRMLDVLVAAGADLNAKSRWWAGGFGLLHNAEPRLAAYAIRRGAVVDVHAAARLGLLDRLRELVANDPALVHARGGDGQTPLHFAGGIEVADFLLDHGADINARDVDHESTPAQYMLRERPAIARHLIRRGCRTDILMAAAVGDLELVRRHLDADPDSIHLRVSDNYFRKINHRSGGIIYQWTLGWHVSAFEVAREFGHLEVLRFLMERGPVEAKLLALCWAGEDESAIISLLAENPGLVAKLSDADRRQLAHAARNNNLPAVRLMLAAGLPVTALGQHQATPLHWAAFHGNVDMAQAILRHNPPLEAADGDYHATPLGWAIHGSENGWHRDTGDYAATVEALLLTGAKPPEKLVGTEVVRAVLRRHGAGD